MTPHMSTSSDNEQQMLQRNGEGRKDKGGGEGSSSEKSCVGQSCIWKMLCDKERWCDKDGMYVCYVM